MNAAAPAAAGAGVAAGAVGAAVQAEARGCRVPGVRGVGADGDGALRVLVVEDNVLLREGLTALLREHDVDVVDAVGDAGRLPSALADAAARAPVDLVVMDIRLPPTFTDEGIRAAVALRRTHPRLGVLILSQYVELAYSSELLAGGSAGVGYLLKERVGNVREFLDALHRVAAGGTALDREVIAELMGARSATARPGELDPLTPREREVLALMAEGRSNSAIAAALVVGPGAVEKHVSNIFAKLGLPAASSDHRRVLAVLTTSAPPATPDPTGPTLDERHRGRDRGRDRRPAVAGVGRRLRLARTHGRLAARRRWGLTRSSPDAGLLCCPDRGAVRG